MLELKRAREYWKIILSGRFKFLEQWIQFLMERYNQRGQNKSIAKDTWNILLIFANKIDEDLGELMYIRDDDNNNFNSRKL